MAVPARKSLNRYKKRTGSPHCDDSFEDLYYDVLAGKRRQLPLHAREHFFAPDQLEHRIH
jgi:hypothetical protein